MEIDGDGSTEIREWGIRYLLGRQGLQRLGEIRVEGF